MITKEKQYGFSGEDMATKYLQSIGYDIVERNYTCPYGEIDIIAKQDETYIFVEVKRKRKADGIRPACNVNYTKQKKITKVAGVYLSLNRLNVYTRFDVIEIVGVEINHIINAFYAVE